MGATLRDIFNGEIKSRQSVEGQLPFNLQKDEILVWAFKNVILGEMRVQRSCEGGYQGLSLRVASGVYYRTGGFQGASG